MYFISFIYVKEQLSKNNLIYFISISLANMEYLELTGIEPATLCVQGRCSPN